MTETANLVTSTARGITSVLYGQLPSPSLLASAQSVAATEKNKSAAQLDILKARDVCDVCNCLPETVFSFMIMFGVVAVGREVPGDDNETVRQRSCGRRVVSASWHASERRVHSPSTSLSGSSQLSLDDLQKNTIYLLPSNEGSYSGFQSSKSENHIEFIM